MFSSSTRTPSGLAKARRCSTEVIAASNLRSSKDSFGSPMCWIRKRNGICSASSIARLISSMASIRARPVGRSDVDRRSAGASPLVIGI